MQQSLTVVTVQIHLRFFNDVLDLLTQNGHHFRCGVIRLRGEQTHKTLFPGHLTIGMKPFNTHHIHGRGAVNLGFMGRFSKMNGAGSIPKKIHNSIRQMGPITTNVKQGIGRILQNPQTFLVIDDQIHGSPFPLHKVHAAITQKSKVVGQHPADKMFGFLGPAALRGHDVIGRHFGLIAHGFPVGNGLFHALQNLMQGTL